MAYLLKSNSRDKPPKTLDKRQSRKLYLLFLGVLVANLAASVYFVNATFRLRASDGAVINAAGRQRMLSQRLLAYVYIGDRERGNAAAARELTNVAEEWRSTHANLLDLGAKTGADASGWYPQLRALSASVERVTRRLRDFRDGDPSAIAAIRQETETFLTRMNAIVGVMATDSAYALRRTQYLGAAFTLATVGLAAVLIFGFLFPEQRRSERLVEEVSEQRDLLERRYGELQRANEGLNLFMHVASHDMKTPLRTIGSFANLIERRCRGTFDAEAEEYFGYIKEGAAGMTRVLDDLVAYNQAGTNRATHAVDLDAVLHAVRIDLRAELREAVAQLVSEPLGQVVASREVVEQLLRHLFRNAILHREPDRSCILRVVRAGRGLAVEDNGRGLSGEYRDRVFEPFRRVGDVSDQGTGMRLPICRALIRSVGGDIDYRARAGGGTVFVLSFAEEEGEPQIQVRPNRMATAESN